MGEVIRNSVTVERKSVKVKRKAVTDISRAGYKKTGGWYYFGIPTHIKPPNPKEFQLSKTERILFCPYCMDWTVYRRFQDDMSVWRCQGICRWANTNDFWVKKVNKISWEDVPLSAIKAMRKD